MEGYNYRLILRKELSRRVDLNTSYSISAFARDLKMSRSSLSEIFACKHGISKNRAENIIETLKLNEDESELFRLSVQSFHSRSLKKRNDATKKLKILIAKMKIETIDFALFETIANWYYYAILELTEIEGFTPSHKWIAKHLGINKELVSDAISILKEVKLIEEVDGGYFATEEITHTPDEIPSKFIKEHHTQILDKAQKALFQQKVDKRHFVSTTISIDESDLCWVKDQINIFRDKVATKLSESTKKNNVYNLSIQFFSLLEEVE